MKSIAAVLVDPGEPLQFMELTLDSPGPREVLVRSVAAGVCHTDLHVARGLLPVPRPCVVGHESAGIVEAVGSAVEYVRAGDHVVACSSLFCGECEYCLRGRLALCTRQGVTRPVGSRPRLTDASGAGVQQASNLGCFSEYLLVHEHSLVKIDPRMPLDVAAVLGCSVTTGIGAVNHTAKVEFGSTVAVIGCGGVGLMVVQAAVQAGALRVIAVDILQGKLNHAASVGATDLIDASICDPVERVLELTGSGVEHAFEVVGRSETMSAAFRMLRPGGAATIVGVAAPDVVVEVPAFSLLQGRTLRGSPTGSNRFRFDIPAYVGLYLQGRLKLDHLIAERAPFADANRALDALVDAASARTALMFAS